MNHNRLPKHRKEFEEYYGAFGSASSRLEQYIKSGVGPFVYFFYYERKLKLVLEKLQASIHDGKECFILDAGCGTGDLLTFLKQRYKSPFVVGVEVSLNQVKKARENLSRSSRSEFCQCYGEYLPFSEEVFDCAISTDVIEHVVDKKRYIEEVIRVLRRGGRLVITSDNPNCGKSGLDQQYHYVSLNGVKYRLKDSWVVMKKVIDIVRDYALILDYGYYRINYKAISILSHVANRLPLRVCAIIARLMILVEKVVLSILSENEKSSRCLFQYIVFEKI